MAEFAVPKIIPQKTSVFVVQKHNEKDLISKEVLTNQKTCSLPRHNDKRGYIVPAVDARTISEFHGSKILKMDSKMPVGRPMKVTTVGDGAVGKTCMLISYTSKCFPTEYIPTVFDNYADTITVDGQPYHLTLWDTAGQEDYDRLRPLSYPNTDLFLVCYSVENRATYDNVVNKWIPEIRHYSPKTKIILVATKIDLRPAEGGENFVTTQDGKKLQSKIKADAFMECSAMTQDNLTEVFEKAVRIACSLPTKKTTSKCTVL